MKQIIPEQKVMVEVEISGHVISREELSEFLLTERSYKGHNFRGVVHVDENMEWQWTETQSVKEWLIGERMADLLG